MTDKSLLKNNQKIEILGRKHKILYEKMKTTRPLVYKDRGLLKVFRSETGGKKHVEIIAKWFREAAREKIALRTKEIAKENGFRFKRLSIKSQRTRWGSCSSDKNLNFNWKLILTSPGCLDYVILHELVHTRVMDHSSKFWDIVEDIMPTYKKHLKKLREYEEMLF